MKKAIGDLTPKEKVIALALYRKLSNNGRLGINMYYAYRYWIVKTCEVRKYEEN